MRTVRWSAMLSVCLMMLAGAWLASPAAAANSACVNPGGTNGCLNSIQAAINSVSAGGIVTVAAGTYLGGDINISQPVTLVGSGMSQSVIDATGSTGAAITVNIVSPALGSMKPAPATRIIGFTIKNATLEGVHVIGSDRVTISGNLVTGNDKGLVPGQSFDDTTCPPDPQPFEAFDCGEGIHLDGATNSTVLGNTVTGNAGGILLSDENGATFNNRVLNNTVTNNILDCGIIMASHSPNGIHNNVIAGNTSSGNGAAGVGIFGSIPGSSTHDNLVAGNKLFGNGEAGVALHIHGPGVTLDNNVIVGNTIHDNGGDPDPAVNLPSIGIEIFSDAANGGGAINGAKVDLNTISSQTVGVYVGTGALSPVLRLNHLEGTTTGVDNAGTGTVDARFNHWGCTAGPGNPGCSGVMGSVLFMPVLP